MSASQTDTTTARATHFTVATPWYHGWNIIAVTILFQAFTFGLMIYSYSFWIEPFQKEFGVGAGSVLLGATMANIGMGLFSPLAGRLMDAHSIRLITTAGIVIFATGYLLIALTTALWQVILIYATLLPIGGILAGVLAAQVATTRWFEIRRGTALGLSSIGTSIGGFIFPPIVTALMTAHGWRLSHVILSLAVVLIMTPIIWIFVRNRHDGDIEPGSIEPAQNRNGAPSLPQMTTEQIIKSKTIWILIGSLIPLMIVFVSIQFNVAPIAKEFGVRPQQAAFLMSAIAVSMIFGKLFFGTLADRTDHRFLIWIALGVLMLCLISLRIAETYWPLMASMALLGFAAGGMLPLMGAIVASRYGAHNYGRVAGLVAPIFTVTAFGPVILGFLRSQFGSYDPIFLLLMVVLVPALGVVYFLDPPARR